jgi:hypothetical protein
MRQRQHLPRRRRLRADLEALPGGVALLRPGQHVTGEAVGQRRLADALAARDQPGVMHAAAGEGLGDLALGVGVTDQGSRLARVREALEAIGLGQHPGILYGGRAGHQPAPPRSRRSTCAQTSAAMASGDLAPSTSTQRCGSALAIAA